MIQRLWVNCVWGLASVVCLAISSVFALPVLAFKSLRNIKFFSFGFILTWGVLVAVAWAKYRHINGG